MDFIVPVEHLPEERPGTNQGFEQTACPIITDRGQIELFPLLL